MLFLDDKPVAYSTDAKLTIKLSTRNISSKEDGDWTHKKGTRFDWSVSTGALFTDAIVTEGTSTNVFESLFDKMVLKAPINAVFAIKSGLALAQTPHATKKKYSGQVLLTGLDPNGPDGDNASYTVTGDGTGKLTKS